MAVDPVASRYAEAVFATAKESGQVEEALTQLRLIGTLIRQHPELGQLMRNPDVDPPDKVQVLERILQHSWSELVRAFVHLVVSMGRSEFLPDIADALQMLVDEEQGRLRVLVRSAHPLSEAVLQRLRTRLEHREQKHVELAAEVAPELLGGLQVFIGHRVVDGSLQRQLRELRERFMSLRVN